jgi:hypothetical protein
MERLGPLWAMAFRELVDPAAPRWSLASSLLYISPGTKSRFPRDVFGQDNGMTGCGAGEADQVPVGETSWPVFISASPLLA